MEKNSKNCGTPDLGGTSLTRTPPTNYPTFLVSSQFRPPGGTGKLSRIMQSVRTTWRLWMPTLLFGLCWASMTLWLAVESSISWRTILCLSVTCFLICALPACDWIRHVWAERRKLSQLTLEKGEPVFPSGDLLRQVIIKACERKLNLQSATIYTQPLASPPSTTEKTTSSPQVKTPSET